MYKIYTQTLLLTVLMLSSWAIHAQISLGGTPKSTQLGLEDAGVQTLKMPSVDVAALLAEDAIDALDNLPYRFAYPFKVNFNLDNSGTWQTLANGDRLWRLKISCQNARSINFLYNEFYIPQGGLLYIYSEDKTQILGAFSAHNNRPSRKFATALLEGTTATLEYFEPAAVAGQGMISIGQVGHGYRGLSAVTNGGDFYTDSSGDCQVNINCSPEGDDWQIEKRSVTRIVVDGCALCTGTLINNVEGDCTPYVLSANHCIRGIYDAITDPDLSGFIFYWNYERAGCENVGNIPNETTAGGMVVANSEDTNEINTSDFALFRLTENPSDVYCMYAAGFDASGSSGTGGVSIHHPNSDIKKIATYSMTPSSVVNNNYWRVFWDQTINGYSVPKVGSSGSALFNSNQQIIGQLFGGFIDGQRFCDAPSQDEGDYGKMSVSWDGSGATDARRRLRDWLDPNNTGQKVVNGKFCTAPDYLVEGAPYRKANCGMNSVTYDISVVSKGGFSDAVSLSVNGLPAGATASFSANPIVPTNSTVLTVSGLSGVGAGNYPFTITSTSTLPDKTTSFELGIATPMPAQLSSPADGSTEENDRPILSWMAAIGAASYDVEVATDPNFNNVIRSISTGATSWEIQDELMFLTIYYWRVRIVRTCGIEAWSAPFTFTTSFANVGTCARPIALNCGETFVGDTDRGENNFQVHDVNGPNSWSGRELIFEFEAEAGDIEIALSGISEDVDLFLYTVCDDPAGSELAESTRRGFVVSSYDTINYTANAPATYFIMVDGYFNAESEFVLTLSCPSASSCGNDVNLSIDDDPIVGGDYFATNTITSMGRVASNTTVLFEAGQTIILSDGFEAESMSHFTARIQVCPTADDRVVEKRMENKAVASAKVKVYPNPFYEQTIVDIELAEEQEVQLVLYDLTGRRIRTILDNEALQVGKHTFPLQTMQLRAGIYLLSVRMGDIVETRRLFLLR